MTRLRAYQVEERAVLDALLDGSRVGHIALVADDYPVMLPTAIARDGDLLLVHGSTGSRWMRAVADGAPVCASVTSLDGIIVARSAFESSLRYRSAVIFGRFERLEGDEKARGLHVLVEKLLPGRTAEVRQSSRSERDKTMVLALPIETWSLKVSDGWPDDEEADVAGDAWAGVVPFTYGVGAAQAAPDLRAGIPLPPSVVALDGR